MNKLKELINRKVLARVSWVELSAVGESKVVKSMAVWLVVVPVMAKFLGPIPESITVSVLGASIQLNMAMPFNIFVFYASAVGFTLGNVIYQWKCPSLIQKHKRIISDIDNSKGVSMFLYELSRMDSDFKEKVSRVVVEKFEHSLSSEVSLLFLDASDRKYSKDDEAMERSTVRQIYLLHACIDEAKLTLKKARAVVGFLYTASFLLLACVFIQNTFVVLEEVL